MNITRRDVIKLATLSPAVSALHAFEQQTSFTFRSALAEDWFRAGRFFEWTSTTANNNGHKVQVYYRTFGSRANPALVLLHGYPTSSFDFRQFIPYLEDEYFIAVLDFPGFGFSDKPQDGYSYMLEDDAKLVDYYVRDILGLSTFHLFTHDRGVSVGLAFLTNYLANDNRDYELTYHFMSNSGMFLPLANLGAGQTVLLDPVRGPERIREIKARGRTGGGTPQAEAYADIQAYNDGIGARLHVGKYLLERAHNEYRWLESLPKSPVPVGYVWGIRDTVNPVRIANHVWMTYLNDRDVESSYWLLPAAGHYLQRDQPEELAQVVRVCLRGEIPARSDEDQFQRGPSRPRGPGAAILVGHTDIREVSFPGAVEYSPSGYTYR